MLGNIVLHSVPPDAELRSEIVGVRLLRADDQVFVSKQVLDNIESPDGFWYLFAEFDGDLLSIKLVCGWTIRYQRIGSRFNPGPAVMFHRTHGLPPAT